MRDVIKKKTIEKIHKGPAVLIPKLQPLKREKRGTDNRHCGKVTSRAKTQLKLFISCDVLFLLKQIMFKVQNLNRGVKILYVSA